MATSKFKPERWTVERAASEFRINPRTLAQRIRAASIEPRADGKFSTVQICAAVFGDLHGEQLRLTREKADAEALANAKAREELVPVDQVYRHYEGVFIAMRQRILASGLSDDEKDELLNDLKRLTWRELIARDKRKARQSTDAPASA